jgi:hypothetical protein
MLIAILGSACSRFVQQNIGEDAAPGFEAGGGMIAGSVTAPFASRFHHGVQFRYRSLGGDGSRQGVLTSASSLRFVPYLPSCGEDGLEPQCGRLFAVELPAGDYEVFQLTVASGGSGYSLPIQTWRFSVSPGQVSYLGSLHMQYCEGLFRNTRGGILGGELSIRDEYPRDVDLLRGRFRQLAGLPVRKQLLPATVIRWRVPYQPYDWGDCIAEAKDTP